MLCTIARKASETFIAFENGVKRDASFDRHSSTRIRKEGCLGSGLGALKTQDLRKLDVALFQRVQPVWVVQVIG